jgi:hypothetical protein
MDSRKNNTHTQTEVKSSRCSICNREPRDDCNWRQGRCPHVPELLNSIMFNTYKTRFYNLLKLITGKK